MKGHLSALISSCLLMGCASQQPPTGGAKDLHPPKLVRSVPKPLATDVRTTRWIFTFDEWITLQDPSTQIFISPIPSRSPLFRLKGKSLIIDMLDTLRPNTTYSITFGTAVRDITEGNIWSNYRHVFSTGSVVDSLRLSGRVVDVEHQTGVAGMLVMLFDPSDDSVVANGRPLYSTRTDTGGYFELTHIRAGQYRLFALDDLNQNYLYDQQQEAIAFWDSMVSPADSVVSYLLYRFKEEPAHQSIQQVRTVNEQCVQLVLTKKFSPVSLRLLADSVPVFGWYNRWQDTLHCWFHSAWTDSVHLIVEGVGLLDTITVLPALSRAKRAGTRLQQEFVLTPVHRDQTFRAVDAIRLVNSLPITQTAVKKKMTLVGGLRATEETLLPVLRQDSLTNRQYIELPSKWEPGAQYALHVPDSMFRDVTGQWNDSLVLRWRILAEEETGNLQLAITLRDSLLQHAYYGELISGQGGVRERFPITSASQEYVVRHLPPGKYRLRIVEDKNANGRWDSGSYWLEQQPERVFVPVGEITIRPNWDMAVSVVVPN